MSVVLGRMYALVVDIAEYTHIVKKCVGSIFAAPSECLNNQEKTTSRRITLMHLIMKHELFEHLLYYPHKQ